MRIWELRTGRLIGVGHGKVGVSPSWSPNGRTLATYDSGIKLWSTTAFRELTNLNLDYFPLGFTGDGRTLVTINFAGRIKCISPPSLAEIDGQQ